MLAYNIINTPGGNGDQLVQVYCKSVRTAPHVGNQSRHLPIQHKIPKTEGQFEYCKSV